MRHNRTSIAKRRSGFSLIELSIVLFIIGLLLSGFLSSFQIFTAKQLVERNRQKTARIQTALSKFVLHDGDQENDPIRFPCPAALDAPRSDPQFGQERCDLLDQNSDGTISGDEALALRGRTDLYILSGTSTSKARHAGLVVLGALPVHSLGLAEEDAFDVHRNRYIYAVSLNYIENNYAALGSTKKLGTITILNEGGGIVTQSAPFFVYSSGADGRGGFNTAGKQKAACRPTQAGDAQNCAWQRQIEDKKIPKAEFRTQYGFSKGANESYYDDYTIYTTYSLGDDVNWWSNKNMDGENIYNTNPGKIWIGRNIANIDFQPQDRLVVDGQLRTTGKIHARDTIVSDGRIGIGTATPESRLQVNGNVQIGHETQACTTSRQGTLRFNKTEKYLELCNGEAWVSIVTSGFIQTPVARAVNKNHTAMQEGTVTATITADTTKPQNNITGYIDGQKVAECAAAIIPGVTTTSLSSFSFSVPKNSIWRIDSSAASQTHVKWSAFGP